MRFTPILFFLLVLQSSINAEDHAPPKFKVIIKQMALAFGRGICYEATPDKIVITHLSDSANTKLPVATTYELSPEQRDRIWGYLKKLKLDTLQPNYVDENVMDGSSMDYEIQLEDRKPIKIHAENKFPKELLELSALLYEMAREPRK